MRPLNRKAGNRDAPVSSDPNPLGGFPLREIERVAIDELEGRVTAMLVTPYPPGIPLLIPGERFNKTIVNYLRFARDFNTRFPGFETDVHGLVKDGNGAYYVDCVR